MDETLDPIVLTAAAVLTLAEQPLGAIEGVAHRVLWTDGTSIAGRMTIAGGHHLGAHQHRRHAHHLWIIDGGVEILGALLGAGSYVHIPPGVEHDLDARTTEGCTVFYVYEA